MSSDRRPVNDSKSSRNASSVVKLVRSDRDVRREAMRKSHGCCAWMAAARGMGSRERDRARCIRQAQMLCVSCTLLSDRQATLLTQRSQRAVEGQVLQVAARARHNRRHIRRHVLLVAAGTRVAEQ